MSFLSLWTAYVFAQNISFEASVNSNKVSLGSTIQLTLTLSGTQNSSPIDLPQIDGFEVRYLGPSTRISIFNGQYFSSVGYIYTLFPLKVGKFQIPSLSVTLDGKTYTTQPIDLEVVDALSQTTRSNENQATGSSVGLEDKVFVIMSTPKKEVFLNEKIPLTVKFFVSGLSVRDLELPEFEHEGFSIDPYGQPSQYQQIVGGARYSVVEFNTFVYPLRIGDLKLGPAKIRCNILYESSAGRKLPSAGFESLFDDEFFDGFFRNYEKRPVTIHSQDLPLNVIALPEEGKPKYFTGAIGKFDFEVSVSPSEVAVGDPVTLKMKISGDGNIKTLNFPALEPNEAFKLYDPQIKEEENSKVLEQVVIPKSVTIKEIPVISFTYFNPETQSYQTIPRGPFPLKVIQQEQKEDFKVVGLQESGGPILPTETIGRDIIFIKDDPGVLRKSGARLCQSPFFALLILIYIVIWTAVFWNFQRSHKIKTDIVYARRLQAPRKAKKGLEMAHRLIQQGQHKEYYDTIFKTLQGYLGDKFHLVSGGITFSAIEDILRSRNVNGEIILNIKSVFDECDMVRYASAGQDKNTMEAQFQNVERIIDFLERHES